MSDQAPRKLTINDPVDRNTLSQIDELETAQNRLGRELLDLEQAKIRVLRSSASAETQLGKLFEKIRMDRGLSPDSSIMVDATTGKIQLQDPGTAAPAEAPSS